MNGAFVHGLPGVRNHEGDGPGAARRIHGDDLAGTGAAGVEDGLFDLGRVDQKTTDAQHVAQPRHMGEASVAVHVAQVARAQKTIVGECLCRRLRIAQVLPHHVGAAELQLARLHGRGQRPGLHQAGAQPRRPQ
ncbi:amino acid adenylation [Alicycliphilus sp. B1]|nr:amino acid adenylation [Alicycliphilus sp. B1]